MAGATGQMRIDDPSGFASESVADVEPPVFTSTLLLEERMPRDR